MATAGNQKQGLMKWIQKEEQVKATNNFNRKEQIRTNHNKNELQEQQQQSTTTEHNNE